MHDITESMLDELEAMLSGKTSPYHKAAWVMALAVIAIFSVMISQGIALKSPVAVIDADASSFSTRLIESVRTSAYIDVTDVINAPVDPQLFTQHDRNVGVLYLPKGLERAAMRGESFNIAYFADTANIAQNAQTISALKEFIPQLHPVETAAPVLAVVERDLFNPVHSTAITFTTTFLFFFSSILYGITTLMIIGRLKISGQWSSVVLRRGPLALMSRIVPYALVYTAAVTLCIGVLVNAAGLRFAGNCLAFVPAVFLTALDIGLLGMVLCWKTSNPAQGASRMILVVPPGFILGGALMTSGFFNTHLIFLKWIWPLSWLYALWRDIALRAVPTLQLLSLYGAFLVYSALLAAGVCALFVRALRDRDEFERDLAKGISS